VAGPGPIPPVLGVPPVGAIDDVPPTTADSVPPVLRLAPPVLGLAPPVLGLAPPVLGLAPPVAEPPTPDVELSVLPQPNAVIETARRIGENRAFDRSQDTVRWDAGLVISVAVRNKSPPHLQIESFH